MVPYVFLSILHVIYFSLLSSTTSLLPPPLNINCPPILVFAISLQEPVS